MNIRLITEALYMLGTSNKSVLEMAIEKPISYVRVSKIGNDTLIWFDAAGINMNPVDTGWW